MKLPCSLSSQLWKYNKNTLSLENGNGAWQHQEIQWVLPNEGETGSMTDKGTSKVLGIVHYKFLTTETNLKALNIFRCFLTQPHQ